MRPITQADIERLYADPTTGRTDLTSAQIEHHIQRGRALRSREAGRLFTLAGRGLWRLVTFSWRQPAAAGQTSGRLTPSNA